MNNIKVETRTIIGHALPDTRIQYRLLVIYPDSKTFRYSSIYRSILQRRESTYPTSYRVWLP